MRCVVGENKTTLHPRTTYLNVSDVAFAKLEPGAVLNFLHIPKTGGTSLNACLKAFCTQNKLKCHSTWTPHDNRKLNWLGKRVSFSNSLARLQAMSPSVRNSFEIIYGHQESYLPRLLKRKILNIAILRNPYARFESEVSFLTRQKAIVEALPETCVPNEEQTTYLWRGSDFRKAEIYPFFPSSTFYARRVTPTDAQLMARLKTFVFVGALETHKTFKQISLLLERRFPNAKTRFHCHQTLNSGKHFSKLNVSAARPFKQLDEQLWKHCSSAMCLDSEPTIGSLPRGSG